MVQKNSKLGFLFLFLGIFTWSTIELTYKLIQSSINPLTANFLRMLIGGIILLIYGMFTKSNKKLKEFLKLYPKYYLPAALIGLVFGQIIFLMGTQMTEANYAATIFSSNPIIISIFTIYFFKEKVTTEKIIGIFLGFFGVVVMVTQLQFGDFLSAKNLLGNLLVFVGMALWCIDVILGKALFNKAKREHKTTGFESEQFNSVTFIVSAIMMIPAVLATGDFARLPTYGLNTWLGLLFLGIVTGGIGYVLFFKGIEMMEASKGINMFYFKPIIATILAFFILGEVPNIFLYIGIVIEIVALLLVSADVPIHRFIVKFLKLNKKPVVSEN